MEKLVELEIGAVADKGVAIGRMGGKAVFVRFAAPGDVALVRITGGKPGWATGELVDLVSPSPLRMAPECPLYSRCGGCSWQHLSAEAELAGKAESLKGFFRSRLGLGEEIFGDPVPSPSSYGYRNRITLTVAPSRGGGSLCMAGLRSHKLVEVGNCPVATRAINEALAALVRLRGFLPAPARLLLQEDDTGAVAAVVETERKLDRAKAEKLSALGREAGLAGVWHSDGKTDPSPLPGFTPSDMTFRVGCGDREFRLITPVGGFVQANRAVSDSLVALALERADRFAGKNVADFYCGSGNFTLPLAAVAGAVTGVEGDRRAAAAAAKNAEAAGLSNVRIISSPVENAIKGEAAKADFWLLDPPRAGAPELSALSMSGPPAIFYVSCDPATMARDLAIMQKNGYAVEKVRAADMFPRTAHLEVTAFLSRRF